MNTTQILCFLAAARCQSFTKAANELYISQPAFSRNIA
ncbi:MAG: LysR family transcriptional regulator, partial [Clostridiales bacterium]|nr:LysR family transcriptional regulator [Clostridiales bacterium]